MAEPFIDIYSEYDFYVPYFEILIQKKELRPEIINEILSLSYTDSLENIDSFEFTVNNWDAEKRDFKFIEGQLKEVFFPGQDIEIGMGYYYKGQKKVNKMLYGEITTLEPNFPASGSSTLNVRGLNILHRLRDKQRSDSYIKQRDSEIAKKLARRIGIKPKLREDIAKENPIDFIFQDNMYDIIFLMNRAKTIGYEIYIEDEEKTEENKKSNDIKKLHFHPSTNAKKNYTLQWGRTLINFTPTLTTANQVSEVVITGWNPESKRRIVGKATRKDLETKALGVNKDIKVIEASLSKRIDVVADRPIKTEKEAKQLAKETLERISKGMVKAKGSTVGLPELKTGTYVEITELGDLFSGTYFITGTTHSITSSGYLTNFTARKEEKK